MEQISTRIDQFLNEHGMDLRRIDMEENCRVFLDEMQKGLAGTDSSLQMIPTYIETDKDVPSDKPVIVMDAGGTHFRVATVRFGQGKTAKIEDFQSYSMPGTENEVTKKQFFARMAHYIEKILDKSSNIGFCFSYPTEILPNKDGRLIRFSKEIKAKQVQGQLIGENLNLAINALGHRHKKHIVILNDTVATLLAGKSVAADKNYSAYIGFILGTGTNCCYTERNENIIKNKGLAPGKKQIINIESGAFAKAPRGDIDIRFDNSTLDAGMSTFEKMISGAYLGPVCLETARIAAADGLFSHEAAEKLNAVKCIDTKDLSDFISDPSNDRHFSLTNKDDITALGCIINKLIERAAKLTAINLSSVVLKSDAGKDRRYPVCIVAEGSTFYRLQTLKQKVEYYLKQYLENRKKRYYEIVNVQNATLIGAAIAGLTN